MNSPKENNLKKKKQRIIISYNCKLYKKNPKIKVICKDSFNIIKFPKP